MIEWDLFAERPGCVCHGRRAGPMVGWDAPDGGGHESGIRRDRIAGAGKAEISSYEHLELAERKSGENARSTARAAGFPGTP